MAKNSDNNQLILDGRIGLVSSLCQVEPILRNPERKRKAVVLDQQFKGVFCAGQSSQSTSHVPDVYAGDFISTFHLPSRRTIRRWLSFASDNVPIPTGDGLSSGSPTLRAVETVYRIHLDVLLPSRGYMLILSPFHLGLFGGAKSQMIILYTNYTIHNYIIGSHSPVDTAMSCCSTPQFILLVTL
uniref:Uncharacterized protein n=1 Tax=Oryza rufipogon TaxID=4529 RepID=A0A0E0PJY2_ORYRU